MSGLSSRGKLVMEAVYKNWLELYGPQGSEMEGQINDTVSALDEIFPPLVPLQQPKLGAQRDQENIKNMNVSKASSREGLDKFPSTNNAPNKQSWERLSYNLSRSSTNSVVQLSQSTRAKQIDSNVTSKFEGHRFREGGDDLTDKLECEQSELNSIIYQPGIVSENDNAKIETLKKMSNNQGAHGQQDNVQIHSSFIGSQVAEILTTDEKTKLDCLRSNDNKLCTGSLNHTILNDDYIKNIISEFESEEQLADQNVVFKKPEIPQNNIQATNNATDNGIEWFYESHRAFNIKWAISNECSVFSNLVQFDSSIDNNISTNSLTANESIQNSFKMPSDVENAPMPCESFENISVDNNDDNDEVGLSNFELPSQFFSPHSTRTLQKVKSEEKQSAILPELGTKCNLKQQHNKVLFSEKKVRPFHHNEHFKCPETFQNSGVGNNGIVVAEHKILLPNIQTGFRGFPSESHGNTYSCKETSFLSTPTQRDNVKQNKTFRIFKTKSALANTSVDKSFLKNQPAPRKLKQQKLDAFSFVLKPEAAPKDGSYISAQQLVRRKQPVSSSISLEELHTDEYEISEVDCKEFDKKSLCRPKKHAMVNRSPWEKIKFQQSLKQVSVVQDVPSQEESGKVVEEKLHFSILMKDTCEKLLDDLKHNLVQEIGLAITYKEGYSQLNKPLGTSKLATCNPQGIMFAVMDTTCDIKYYYLDICSPSKTGETREFLLNLLNNKCRVICCEAQEIFALLIDEFQLPPRKVCSKWLMMDPMIGCWLLDPDNPVFSFREAAQRLRVATPTNQELQRAYNASAYGELNHCCHLLQMLSLVAEKLYESLSSQNLWELFTEVELKLTPLLAAMELRGICVDKLEFQKMNILLKERAELLQKAAHKAAGKNFLLTSHQQLRTILYDELKLDKKHGIQVKETSILKAKSTSESMLRLLEPVHSLPGIILEYRHIQKIKSTYVDGMLQQIKNNSTIFTTWEQTATATGRLSSSSPNLQAVPKHPVLLSSHIAKGHGHPPLLLRSPYVSRPGFSFLAADFQHVEFRVFAHLAQDPALLRAFQQPGDIFQTLTTLWLEPGGTGVSGEDREKTKRIVYSVMYGAGAGKLAEFLQVDSAQAKRIINNFIGKFPALRSFFNSVVSECRQKKELHTFSGRRRLFPAINSLNLSLRSQAERQAINFLIQGTAADICKAAMLQTEERLKQRPDLEAYLLLQIHDELLWEVRDSHLDQVRELVRAVMEDNSGLYCGKPKMMIPLPVIITTGKNWAGMTASSEPQ